MSLPWTGMAKHISSPYLGRASPPKRLGLMRRPVIMAFLLFVCYNACNKLEKEVFAMAIENGAWIMRGLDWDEPCRIRSWQDLVRWIDQVGFLPLFKNEITGFSAEEHTSDLYWWTGDPEQDPW